MGLTTEQIAFIDRQLRGVDADSIRATALERREAIGLERLLPGDWREQARTLSFTGEQNRAIDSVFTALHSYHGLEQELPPARIAERLERVAAVGGSEQDNLARYVFAPLLQLVELERQLRDRVKRSLLVDTERLSPEQLPDALQRLVEAEVARVNRRNEFFDARTLAQLKTAGQEAVEAAEREMALFDKVFEGPNEELEYIPILDERGVIVMSVCSRVRPRRRTIARGNDDDDDDNNNEENYENDNENDELARRVAGGGNRMTLDTALFAILWQAFKFIAWHTLSDGLPAAVEILVAFYNSGYNQTTLKAQYENLGFKGYERAADVPIESWLFGEYGTGLYLMEGQVEATKSVSLNLYKTIEGYVETQLIRGAAVMFGRDKSFLAVLLTAIVIRTLINRTVLLGGYVYHRMISRVRRYGNPKASTCPH